MWFQTAASFVKAPGRQELTDCSKRSEPRRMSDVACVVHPRNLTRKPIHGLVESGDNDQGAYLMHLPNMK